ncbi:Asp23/Gls24 family envelope stress response protein [Microaceticoccus formicicus]|uniref:Asp23/Gls24 family envelope stress response protein n=1 Tax=Microaceticoccus formicicus TaxID=3118105 RepID=UPI003CD03563|nr:Asp23/Gls24 family envelope stress response protein [Peptoniphilaceae bacterium AMB_02]
MNKNGTVKISNFIIIKIAGLAALDIEGVHEVVGFNEDSFSYTKQSADNKGIKMEIIDNKIYLELTLLIDVNHNIPKVAKDVQEAIIDQVRTMTGLEVVEVNLIINGIV